MTNKPNNYDLEKRTTEFGKSVISTLKKVQINPLNSRIINQLVGSSGSIGANYSEANEAESKKDFIHKISICKKEAKETKHWLELFNTAHPNLTEEIVLLSQENHELILIFSKIIKTAKGN